ncbi:MAG: hypothetical protein N2Z20_00035 [Elusimicrobiales bacterium]|nr:hypothetical protein [Elusimicrobiales bacterium]
MIKFFLHNKLVKFFYAIFLLPLCFTLLKTLIYVITNVEFQDKLVVAFFIGMGSYVVFHLVFYKPIKFYVLGHELVHVLSTYLCGGKIKNIKISNFYGCVNVNKVNTFIALSPYFVPFYSIIITLLWIICRYLLKLKIPTEVFMFLLGFSIMFHLILTIYAIYVGQTDFRISGWLFSIVVILIVNCLILIFLFTFIFSSKIKINELKDYFFGVLVSTYKFFYFKLKLLLSSFLKNFNK